jgi:Protein of unknown function (DUF559)
VAGVAGAAVRRFQISPAAHDGWMRFGFLLRCAKLAVELDDFQYGLPGGIQRDERRENYLAEQGVETLRFWNHQWQKNHAGCLLEIWNALQRRTGCVRIMKNAGEQKFVPPKWEKIQLGGKTNPSP